MKSYYGSELFLGLLLLPHRPRRNWECKSVRCAMCGNPCECLGSKIAIPPKSQVKRWEELEQSFFAQRSAWLAKKAADRIRMIHTFEKEIMKLEGQPGNPDRARKIADLRRRLERERNSL